MKKKIMQIFTMLAWACILVDTDSYYMPYLFVVISAFVCFYVNEQNNVIDNQVRGGVNQVIIQISAGIYSIIVSMANYSIWYEAYCSLGAFGYIYRGLLFIVLGIGGFYVAQNILYCSAIKLYDFSWKRNTYQISPMVVFAISFVAITILDIFILLVCEYPGNMSPDSFTYIDEMYDGFYTNHHPYYHALVVKEIIVIGLKLFHEINAAVAFFSIFQIMFMAMCFSIIVSLLYQYKVPLFLVAISIFYYTLMPFHIVYSYTMWKDVWWGGLVALYTAYLYKILHNAERKMIDVCVFSILGLGVCLFRSNGFFVFAIVFIAFIILFGKKEKKICITMMLIMFVAFLMKYPVLEALEIQQPDTEEKLSIPLQQIARAIVDHDDFTAEETSVLEQVLDLEIVREVYRPYLSDPIKNHMRDLERENGAITTDTWLELFKTYIKIGLKHPVTYVKAWIDQTRGFWNSGYSYSRWGNDIFENKYGIEKTVYSNSVKEFYEKYLWVFQNNRVLQLFLCIGFYVWIDLFLCIINIIRRNRLGILITMPIIATVLSLVISTPVFAEFRYVYAVFCSLPFVMVVTFIKEADR